MNNSNYFISAAISLSDGTILDISNRIKKFNIQCSISSYMFPVIYIDCPLIQDEFQKVSNDNSKRVQISIRRVVASEINAGEAQEYDYIWKDKLFCVLDNNNSYMDTSRDVYNAELEASNASSSLEYRMMLILESDLNTNKVNFSGCFGNCNMKSLLMMIMNSISTDKPTIIATPDNYTMYDQVLVPFNTAIQAIQYLDNVYGIYTNGARIFFDVKKNYILNDGVSNYETDNLSNSVILNIEDSTNLVSNSNLPNTINVLNKNINYTNVSNIQSEYQGNDNAFIMNSNEDDNGIQILRQDWSDETSTIDGLPNKQKVYYQKYSNPYTKNKVNPNRNMVIYMNLYDANMDLISFENIYTINGSTSSEITNCDLILNDYTHIFTRSADNQFNLQSAITLMKL